MANTLAYGFVGLEHLFSQRVVEVGVQVVYDAIRQSADEHTRQINGLLGSFVELTTKYKERYALPGSGTLQPLDEWGNPRVVKQEGYYDVAYPIQGGGTAWGDNRVTREIMTVEEANRNTIEAQRMDADWMRRHILAAVFDPSTWTFDDKEFGDLTIQPLAITSDGVTYLRTGGSSSTDEHYLAQAASIDDDHNPFDDIYDELMEHPSNAGGPVVTYVPTNLTSSIEALTAFLELSDPDIVKGLASDRLDEGGVTEIRGFGDEVLGKVNKNWIVEWRALPDDFMLAHARGGGPVVKQREYDAPALRGFFPERFSPDGNLMVTRMLRYSGFGVSNRVAAVAYKIGNASYAVPTGYSTPLAV